MVPEKMQTNNNKISLVTKENSYTVTTKVKAPSPEPSLPYLNIYQWSSELTAERTSSYDDFLWTPDMKKLLRDLLILKNQFVAVKGLQGVGKTRFKEALYWELRKRLGGEENSVFSVKWGAWSPEDYESYFPTQIIDRLKKEVLTPGEREALHCYNKLQQLDVDLDWYDQYREKHPTKFKKFLETFMMESMASAPVLIDMPDYDKNHVGQFIKDLKEIGIFWEKLGKIALEGGEPGSLVFFVQHELYEKVRHFIFGKPEIFNLKPLAPEDLIEWHKQKFSSVVPFIEEALLLIAKLSQGIWRRYKRYIKICLEKLYDLPNPNTYTVTLKNVNDWITNDQLVEDMVFQLCDVFSDKHKRKQASIVVRNLLEKREMPQSEILKLVFDNDNAGKKACSLLLSKLETYNFVTRRREGKEKIVCWKGGV